MGERDPPRVERVPRELEQREVGKGELAVGASGEAGLVGAVELVAHDGGSERGQVDAYLMLPPGLEIAGDARVSAPVARRRLEHLEPDELETIRRHEQRRRGRRTVLGKIQQLTRSA